MLLESRSYSGKKFRPKPLVATDVPDTLLAASSWNLQDHAQLAMGKVKEFLSVSDSEDVTVIGTLVEAQGSMAQRLTSALMVANQSLLAENSNEYVAGVEFLALHYKNSTLSWAHVGSPHVFLETEKGLQPICYSLDWAWQTHQESPLISEGLGFEKKVALKYGSYRLPERSSLILISRSYVPGSIFSMPKVGMAELANALTHENGEMPYWLGRISL